MHKVFHVKTLYVHQSEEIEKNRWADRRQVLKW
jgi:hypothetical protein